MIPSCDAVRCQLKQLSWPDPLFQRSLPGLARSPRNRRVGIAEVRGFFNNLQSTSAGLGACAATIGVPSGEIKREDVVSLPQGGEASRASLSSDGIPHSPGVEWQHDPAGPLALRFDHGELSWALGQDLSPLRSHPHRIFELHREATGLQHVHFNGDHHAIP